MASKTAQTEEGIHDINVTPLVDIMLVLLIIFMVTAALDAPAPRETIGVNLPRASSGADAPPPTLSIVIPEEGPVRLDGADATVEVLGARVRRAAAGSKEAQAVVAADRAVDYQRVVEVVDVVREGGITKLALSVEGDR